MALLDQKTLRIMLSAADDNLKERGAHKVVEAAMMGGDEELARQVLDDHKLQPFLFTYPKLAHTAVFGKMPGLFWELTKKCRQADRTEKWWNTAAGAAAYSVQGLLFDEIVARSQGLANDWPGFRQAAVNSANAAICRHVFGKQRISAQEAEWLRRDVHKNRMNVDNLLKLIEEFALPVAA